MSDWPKRYECLDLDEDLDYNTPDRWIQCVSLEDFERILEFAAKAMIAGKLIENHDIKGVEKIILETIRGNND